LHYRAQVKAQEEARRWRRVLLRVQQALDAFRELDQQMAAHVQIANSPAHAADVRGKLVESKVSWLLALVKSQQQEIKDLREQLGSSKSREASASCAQPSPRAQTFGAQSEGDESRGAALFLKQQRLHADEGGRRPGAPRTVSSSSHMLHHEEAGSLQGCCAGAAGGYASEHRVMGAAYARHVMEFSALQAHVLMDVCEEVLLRGVAAALEMLDQALRCLCVRAPVLPLHACLPAAPAVSSCRMKAAYPHPAWSSLEQKPAAVEWWWLSGDNLYDVYC
jgi:hypothetical protein